MTTGAGIWPAALALSLALHLLLGLGLREREREKEVPASRVGPVIALGATLLEAAPALRGVQADDALSAPFDAADAHDSPTETAATLPPATPDRLDAVAPDRIEAYEEKGTNAHDDAPAPQSIEPATIEPADAPLTAAAAESAEAAPTRLQPDGAAASDAAQAPSATKATQTAAMPRHKPSPARQAVRPPTPRLDADRTGRPRPHAPPAEASERLRQAESRQAAARQRQRQAQQQRASAHRNARATSRYAGIVRARIASAFGRAARPVRGNGTVTVRLTLTRGGNVSSARIVRSSGRPDLDRAALAAVRAATYPAFPREIADASLTFSIPLGVR